MINYIHLIYCIQWFRILFSLFHVASFVFIVIIIIIIIIIIIMLLLLS